MPRLLAFTQSARDPASRFRLVQYLPALRQAGWQVDHRPNRPDRQWVSPLKSRVPRGLHNRAARVLMSARRWREVAGADRYDVVFVNRDLARWSMGMEPVLLRRNPRIVYDFDDALYVGGIGERRAEWYCRHAAWVTPGNETLAEYARRHNDNVTVIPTVIDVEAYRVRNGSRAGDSPVRVGWSGADTSIRSTLIRFLPVLVEAQRKVDFELVVITNTRPELPVPDDFRWTFVPWRPEQEGRMAELFDIGIMPLRDDVFERGKCGLKLLQYMAAGLPSISSPVGVNREITVEGRTGLLASSSEEWIEALEHLVRSPELHRPMGEASRRRCVEEYSVARWLPTVLDVLDRASRVGRGRVNRFYTADLARRDRDPLGGT